MKNIDFSNIISKTDIKILAEADEHEVVRDVQEFYCDYVAAAPHFFSINISDGCYDGRFNAWNRTNLERTTDGIISVLLSLRRNPTIRYQASSDICKRLAENVRQVISKEGSLFTFKGNSSLNYFSGDSDQPPVLLLLERKIDSVTPILNQVCFDYIFPRSYCNEISIFFVVVLSSYAARNFHHK